MSYATRSRQNSISSPEEIYMPDEDNDVKKGAVESETRDQHSQTSLEGQLAHRTEDARIKGRDTDFPDRERTPNTAARTWIQGSGRKPIKAIRRTIHWRRNTGQQVSGLWYSRPRLWLCPKSTWSRSRKWP